MITLKGKTYTVRNSDGSRREHTVPDLHFTSAAALLRHLVDNGGIRTVSGGIRSTTAAYLGDPDNQHRAYNAFGPALGSGWTHDYEMDNDLWDQLYTAQLRIKVLHHQLREVDPGWTEVEEIHYADNSIVSRQRATDGRTREVTLTGPSGDLCF